MNERPCRTRPDASTSTTTHLDFNFNLPSQPPSIRKWIQVAGLVFAFGSGCCAANILHVFTRRGTPLTLGLAVAASIAGTVVLQMQLRRMRKWKRAFDLALANAKLALKAKLAEAMPDDPVAVARFMQEFEAKTKTRMGALE